MSLGEKKRLKVVGLPVTLVKSSSGLVAFDDQCPHLGASLATGHLNPFGEITCPWHTYRFNLKTGEEAENRCSGLTFYKLVEEDNKLYVQVNG